MTIEKVYRYTDQYGMERTSFEERPITACQVRYKLDAGKDKVLFNLKTGKKSQGVIIPEWELKHWEEMDI